MKFSERILMRLCNRSAVAARHEPAAPEPEIPMPSSVSAASKKLFVEASSPQQSVIPEKRLSVSFDNVRTMEASLARAFYQDLTRSVDGVSYARKFNAVDELISLTASSKSGSEDVQSVFFIPEGTPQDSLFAAYAAENYQSSAYSIETFEKAVTENTDIVFVPMLKKDFLKNKGYRKVFEKAARVRPDMFWAFGITRADPKEDLSKNNILVRGVVVVSEDLIAKKLRDSRDEKGIGGEKSGGTAQLLCQQTHQPDAVPVWRFGLNQPNKRAWRRLCKQWADKREQ